MKFTYTPEGAEPRVFDYQPGKLLSPEAEKIEDLTGWSYAEFGQHLMTSSMKAFHALLYIFLKRSNPTLKYDQVIFSFDEVDIAYDQAEAHLMIRGLREAKAKEGIDSDSQVVLDELIEEFGEPPAEPVAEESAGPKASASFEQPGAGSSPTSSTSDPERLTDSQSTN